MAGFMTTSTAMTVCRADASAFAMDKLRQFAFNPDMDADGVRMGWVGLGDMLDSDRFELAMTSGEYAGFSFRRDCKKPSGAVIKLQLAEAIQNELAKTGKVSGKRKKELKELITAKAASKADFVPSVVDCIWDLKNSRLFVAISSFKALEPVAAYLHTTFGVQVEPVLPQEDIGNTFAVLLKDGELGLGDFTLTCAGTANLATPEQAEEKSQLTVQNYTSAASSALADGMTIKKIQIVATSSQHGDLELACTLDSNLCVSGLKLAKPEKDAEPDATFAINADTCGLVADIVEKLSAN